MLICLPDFIKMKKQFMKKQTNKYFYYKIYN